ncbi:MAG: hypothetical protein FWF09_08130 [Bacteroidales bacterium]|nr:hypothetical protein [Bacteroidales bacterium]
MMKKFIKLSIVLLIICLGTTACSSLFKSRKIVIVYSSVFVPEEGGINFVQITTDSDAVASPGYSATWKKSFTTEPSPYKDIRWYRYPVLAVSKDGESIGYISHRNGATNVMIKSTKKGGSSVQQTFRSDVRCFAFSPDGSKVCYTEYRDEHRGIYMMNYNKGTVTQKISPTGLNDEGPSMSKDGNTIFLDRRESNSNYGLWSYNVSSGLFTNYSHGSSPCIDPSNNKIIYCARINRHNNRSNLDKTGDKTPYWEIWKVNTETGAEELILTEPNASFSCPQVSPDGKWILVTGANKSNNGIWNTNLFVIQSNGTNFRQLTFHPGNDMSGVWSPDGKSIYFISQRGTEKGLYNVWKMDFQEYAM